MREATKKKLLEKFKSFGEGEKVVSLQDAHFPLMGEQFCTNVCGNFGAFLKLDVLQGGVRV